VVPLYQSVSSGLLIGLKGEISGSLGVYAIIKILCLYKETDMKKIIVGSLAFLMTIGANATNWVEIANTPEKSFYIDTDSVNITSENSKMLTAFFRGSKLNSKGKKFDSDRQQLRINCRNKSYAVLSALFYDSNGKVINSYDSGMSFNPNREAHPDTLASVMIEEACYTGGFSQQ